MNQFNINFEEYPILFEAKKVLDTIARLGYEAVIVGGAVRDLVMGNVPNDIDIATNMDINFLSKIYDCHDIGKSKDFGLIVIRSGDFLFEVAQYRTDGTYSDGRHPDHVEFAKNFFEDAARRDFTINAMGINLNGELLDYFGGLEDIKNKVIKMVGSPRERIEEDKLRMLRALRFSAKFQFSIDPLTMTAIKEFSKTITDVSIERIRDELVKTCESGYFYSMILLMHSLGLLQVVIPEVSNLYSVEQKDAVRNIHMEGNAFNHTILCMKCAKSSVLIQLAALFHDVGKAYTRTVSEEGKIQFLEHHEKSAGMTEAIMRRLKFDNDTISKVVILVKNHMCFHRNKDISVRSIRKIIRKVGESLVHDLLDLTEADCCSNYPVQNYVPDLRVKVQKVLDSPILIQRKAIISGNGIMLLLNIGPGKLIGEIQSFLLDVEDEYAENEEVFTIEMAEKEILRKFSKESV